MADLTNLPLVEASESDPPSELPLERDGLVQDVQLADLSRVLMFWKRSLRRLDSVE
jgi:hypothetical protein